MCDEEEGLKIIDHLNECATFTESGNFIDADTALYHLSHLASPHGDSMQRVATYFTEALAHCQLAKNMRGVPKVLRLVRALSTPEQQLVKKLFFDFYPFLKISHTITNQTIIEAMQGETAINVLDLSPSSNAEQWISLMQGLRERLTNTPYLKITLTAIHEKREVLEQMELHLKVEAERLNFHFKFNPVVSTLESLDPETLPIKKGEPLAISCVLQLHSLLAANDDEMVKIRVQRDFAEMLINQKNKKVNRSPDSALSPFSPCPSQKMESFLNGLWRLQPRVMVITEQESNVNGASLRERVCKALSFYGTLFDCLDASASRTLLGRSLLEKMLLGEEIKNIVACEGVERKERHEKLETWIPRLELAGFGTAPVSSNGIWLATKLLQSYVPGYHIHQKNKFLFICWEKIPLFSISAWKF
ncbi:scarecrow-like protein 3 [Vigna unguiculata]|uniref:DELLA protein n=1 Tax=Vigna unguiculata TaxID=3917 RepID=A0A4D6LKT6_VIGUN|nr:scarecrow-like protein 3 [Vigna unguiculata]QCD88916.1 DELLA protein [Vigna unguiculata]